jgi:hypothetical protein
MTTGKTRSMLLASQYRWGSSGARKLSVGRKIDRETAKEAISSCRGATIQAMSKRNAGLQPARAAGTGASAARALCRW